MDCPGARFGPWPLFLAHRRHGLVRRGGNGRFGGRGWLGPTRLDIRPLGEARETQNPSATATVDSINDAMTCGRTPIDAGRATASSFFGSDAGGSGPYLGGRRALAWQLRLMRCPHKLRRGFQPFLIGDIVEAPESPLHASACWSTRTAVPRPQRRRSAGGRVRSSEGDRPLGRRLAVFTLGRRLNGNAVESLLTGLESISRQLVQGCDDGQLEVLNSAENIFGVNDRVGVIRS